jgi:hypothetical protein
VVQEGPFVLQYSMMNENELRNALERSNAALEEREKTITELRERVRRASENLEWRKAMMERRSETISQLADELRRERSGAEAFPADRVIWIFCSARTGSSWLARMLGELGGMWNEPYIGALFGEFYFERYPRRRGLNFIMADEYPHAWLPAIRNMVLHGISTRYHGDGYMTIKEPHGTVGAPVMVKALPESRVILLVRDPRDVAASNYDSFSEGSWAAESLKRQKGTELTAAQMPNWFETRSQAYLWELKKASEAYRLSKSPKAIVRYEDLRDDPFGEMRRLCDELELDAGDEVLRAAVEKFSWENVPDEKKGPGRIYRKATPGGWQDDLTPEQVSIVEANSAPIFNAFYNGKPEPLEPAEPGELPPFQRTRGPSI